MGDVGECIQLQFPVPENLSHYVISHPSQLSLAIPPWVGAIKTAPVGGDAMQLGVKPRMAMYSYRQKCAMLCKACVKETTE